VQNLANKFCLWKSNESKKEEVVSTDDRMSDVRYVRRVLATLRSCRHRDRRGIVGSFPDYAPQALVHTELDACLKNLNF
jgi:hypothetical protein